MLKLKNKDIVQLNGWMVRLGVITRGLKEFWVMLCFDCPHVVKCLKGRCPNVQQCYIEEYDWKNDAFLMVEDDEEIEELVRFAELHKLTDIAERANEMVDSGMGKIIFR